MAWIQLTFTTTKDTAENISDFLTELGAISITYTDPTDTPIFEPNIGETQLWEHTELKAIFDTDIEISLIIAALLNSGLVANDLAYTIDTVEDKDWQREWMENYHPLQISENLWICPSWRQAPDPKAINIILDPGLAFGTGTHPTTALCLAWLADLDLNNKTIIDFGCGSGILAVAALKLGAKQAIGIDIDPQAIEASQANALKNNVKQQLQLYLSHEIPKNLQADIVVANILAGPLKQLYPVISQLIPAEINKEKYLCLSGILAEQAEDVATCYQTNFDILAIDQQEDWCRIIAKRK